jgi:hypothetical protein
MTTQYPEYKARPSDDLPPPPAPPEGWALGGLLFAACMLMLAGTFQVIAGIVALVDDDFYVRTANYTFDLDTTAWGWVHLIIGAVLLLVALGLFNRSTWAGVAALAIAILSAIANFFFIPYYPVWALVLIGIDVWVIWALTRPGAIRT